MEQDKNIKFLSSKFLKDILELEKEIENMNVLFNDVKTRTSNIANSWQGESSDNNLRSFQNFQNCFEQLDVQNKKYAKFLEDTYAKYKYMEDQINKSINDGAIALGSYEEKR